MPKKNIKQAPHGEFEEPGNGGDKKYDSRGRLQEKAWYILVVFPGRELAIRDKLIKLAANEKYKEQIFRIFCTAKKVTTQTTTKKGVVKTKVKEDLIVTQYVFVEMILNDDTYHAIKIEGVRHILGSPGPIAISEHDVRKQFALMGERFDSDETFSVGDEVQIIAKDLGAFNHQKGVVKEANADSRKAVIAIEMFGRETPTDVTFDQIRKL